MSSVSPARHSKRRRSAFRAFSLIEVIVVIAIIATLTAILFPVFAQSQERNRQTVCLSNEKQLGIGIITYAQDYSETLPPNAVPDTSIPPPNNPRLYVFERTLPYVKNESVLHCPDDDTDDNSPTGRFAIFKDQNGLGTSGPGRFLFVSYYPVGFGSSGQAYWGLFQAPESNPPARPVPLSDCKVPAETIMFTERRSRNAEGVNSDSTLDIGLATPTGGDSGDANNGVTRRHSQGANYIFTDGHAKWFARGNGSAGDATGANVTLNGVRYYYFWRKGAAGKM